MVTLHVGDELLHGDIELLGLAGQVHSSDQDFFGMIIHHGVVEVEPLEIVERCSLDIVGHGRLKLVTKLPQLHREVEDHIHLILLCQEVTFTSSSWRVLLVAEEIHLYF